MVSGPDPDDTAGGARRSLAAVVMAGLARLVLVWPLIAMGGRSGAKLLGRVRPDLGDAPLEGALAGAAVGAAVGAVLWLRSIRGKGWRRTVASLALALTALVWVIAAGTWMVSGRVPPDLWMLHGLAVAGAAIVALLTRH